MRHSQLARRAGVPVAAAVLGALVATPALADAKVVAPETAYQGSGQNVTVRVTNDGTAPIHTITVKFRDDTPLAEAYPLSVENWAPSIKMRKISTPLPTLHGGTETTEVAASITWLAMPGKDLAPGRSTDLSVAVGPLPQLSSIQLDVATTYAGGKAGPAMPPATMALTPDPTGGLAAQAHSHGGATGGSAGSGTGTGEEQLFKQAIEDADRGGSVWTYAGWIVAALALAGGAVMMLRSRHRAEEPEPADEDETAEDTTVEEKEPVTAGSGSSKWAFKG